MKKYIFFVLLAVSLVFIACDPDNPATFDVSTKEQWKEAIESIKVGGNIAPIISLSGDFSVEGTPNGTYTFGDKTGFVLTILGYGHKITLSSPGYIFNINDGQSVILQNTKLEGINNNTEEVVRVYKGTFNMTKNAEVYNNKSSLCSAVYIEEGTFTMGKDCKIYNNENGGGGGGGVRSNKGTCTMSENSSIYNNKATGVSGNGGGVLVNGGAFTMQGNANIYGNSAVANGGGVYITALGAFIMNGETTVKGSNAPATDRNTASSGASIFINSGTAKTGGGEDLIPGSGFSSENTISAAGL